jgi:flagellar hook-associated protein 3 FlgL
MRVTNSGQRAIATIQSHLEAMAKTQEQVSSGLRVSKPSDAPLAAAQLLNLNSGISRSNQYQRNIESGMTALRSTDDALGRIQELLTKARSLAVQGGNESLSSEDRVALANEVDEALRELLTIANEKSGNRYLFGGSETRSAPYLPVEDDSGRLVDVAVKFDQPPQSVQIASGDGEVIEITLSATDTFDLSGGDSVFKTLLDLRNALDNDSAEGASAAIPRFDAALDQLGGLASLVGSRVQAAQNQLTKLVSQKVEMTTRVSDLGDTDLVEAMTRLQQEQTAYQISLQTIASVMQSKLADFVSL